MKSIRWRWIAAVALGVHLALWLNLHAQGQDGLLLTVIVRHETSYDSAGLEFFSLAVPGKGRFLLSADKDLPVAVWLKGRNGERVSLELSGK